MTHHGMSDIFVYSCVRMESFGISCVHILVVLVRLDISDSQRHPRLICVRLAEWTTQKHFTVTVLVRSCNIAKGSLELLVRVKRTLRHNRESGGVHIEARNDEWGRNAGVRDPIGVRTKRTGHSNEPAGSRAVKLRKCNTCGCLGHRRTRCPNGPQVATSNMEKDTVSYTGNESNRRRKRID
ncbi:hypothetical protein Ahy_B09g097708 [Arachis hypogaea]|uniref:Uncharacterized protein n=1 Tax=Arachis hypogaea TaxID=3818 RepID=A0A444XPP7_ARAHY|nr:hypothetical protein Ahy_B09g097708 [Arachis hypogaea]